MTARNSLRFLSAMIVFAAVLSVTSSNVYAQPKNPQSLSDAQPDKRVSAELNFIYFNKQIADTTAAINLHPGDVSNYYQRGEAYIGLKRYDEALSDFDKIIELSENSDSSYVWRGYINVLRNHLDEAVKDFNKALEINPKNEYARESLETTRLKINEYLALIRTFERQIAERPNNPDLYRCRAETYLTIGKRKEAEADLKKIEEIKDFLKKDVFDECVLTDYRCQIAFYNERIKVVNDFDYPPDIGLYYSGRAIAYYENGNLEDALKDLNASIEGMKWTRKVDGKIIKIKPQNNDRDFVYRGQIYFRQGLYSEALKDLERSASPSFPDTYGFIGEIYRIRKEYDKASDAYAKAIDYNRRNARAYFGRAMIYLKIGDDARELENDEAKAVEAYRKAIKDFDTVVEIDLKITGDSVYLQRAGVYEKLNEPDKAAADRAKAEEIAEKP